VFFHWNAKLRTRALPRPGHVEDGLGCAQPRRVDDVTSFLPSWRALGQEHRKESLSLKANVKHQRVPIPGGGGDDERYQLLVNVENDGEQDATDFRLDVDFPSTFLDESGHVLRVASPKPGFERFQITNVARGIEQANCITDRPSQGALPRAFPLGCGRERLRVAEHMTLVDCCLNDS
jgi:hypothetical protein